MTISFSLLLNRRINLEKKQEKSPFPNYNIPVFRDLPILVFFLELVEKLHTEMEVLTSNFYFGYREEKGRS